MLASYTTYFPALFITYITISRYLGFILIMQHEADVVANADLFIFYAINQNIDINKMIQ